MNILSFKMLFLILFLFFGLLSLVFGDCRYQSPPAQPRGMLEESFKVLTINVYGQHDDGDSACKNRIQEIARHIRDASPAYNIAGLQEWHSYSPVTCDGVELKKIINDIYPSPPVTGFFRAPKGSEWGHYRWGHPEAYRQINGGLGLISSTPYLWKKYESDDFSGAWWDWNGDPVRTNNVHQFMPSFKPARTAHGFIFARIFLRYPDIAVDTYVVHLTSTGDDVSVCNLKCKQGMLEQLREGIHRRSAKSGFPVLVMGDFNIGGPNPPNSQSTCTGADGYGDIMRNLGNPKDLWLEARPGEAGNTYGFDGDGTPKRIDFMFVPNDSYLVSSPYEITLKDPAIIDTIVLSDSDHKGIVAELEVRQKINPTPMINLSRSNISFGSVAQKDVSTRVLKISNHGLANLSISIDPSPPPPQGQPKSGFFWNSLSTLIPPRQSRNFVVNFSPRAKGRFEGTLLITSNSTESPHSVRLGGRGRGLNNNTNNPQGSGGNTNNPQQPL